MKISLLIPQEQKHKQWIKNQQPKYPILLVQKDSIFTVNYAKISETKCKTQKGTQKSVFLIKICETTWKLPVSDREKSIGIRVFKVHGVIIVEEAFEQLVDY